MSWKTLAGLTAAVLAVSFGAPLARATVAAPLAVAMWRMAFSAAILLPVAAARGGLRFASEHRRPALLAGVLLGFHFGLWIPSLWLTSVSASVVLVTTQPATDAPYRVVAVESAAEMAEAVRMQASDAAVLVMALVRRDERQVRHVARLQITVQAAEVDDVPQAVLLHAREIHERVVLRRI